MGASARKVKQRSSALARFHGHTTDLDCILSDILTLAQELKENTIDKILAKGDAEMALDELLGRLKL